MKYRNFGENAEKKTKKQPWLRIDPEGLVEKKTSCIRTRTAVVHLHVEDTKETDSSTSIRGTRYTPQY